MEKLPISAMVVGFNEAHFLQQCFESISFCNEIVYTDLGSTDESVKIAEQFAEQIFHRGKVPSCEMIQTEVVHYLKNDWVIFIDPDEKVDQKLAEQIIKDFEKLTSNPGTGAIMVPWQFYFKGKPLAGTVWGGSHNKKYFLVNKYRFEFLPVVHYGRKLKDGFSSIAIDLNSSGTNILHHYWMNSYKVFIAKHRRYLENEGKDNYNLGVRTGIKGLFKTPFKEFYNSYIKRKGYKDGFIGLFLSMFWSYYKSIIAIDIYKLQQRTARDGNPS